MRCDPLTDNAAGRHARRLHRPAVAAGGGAGGRRRLLGCGARKQASGQPSGGPVRRWTFLIRWTIIGHPKYFNAAGVYPQSSTLPGGEIQMNYWLDLFTGTTWREFQAAGSTVTGFREFRWKRAG